MWKVCTPGFARDHTVSSVTSAFIAGGRVYKIHPEIPETLSAEARAFVLSCFEPDPHKRVTAAGLLQEGFLRQVNKGQKNRIAFKPAGEACWDGRGDGSPER